MGRLDLERLKERILERYDPDYLVDVLDITASELLEAFEERLIAKACEFTELEDND